MQVSGAISMSQLRAEFKDTTSGSVSMSELTRGGSFIKNELFVDPSSTIKTTNAAGSSMAMSNYYNTTKGREKTFATGTVEEFAIPANMNRVMFWVQGGGGGAARRTGCADPNPARRARGGGGGGYIACNLLQNQAILTWQGIPASMAGGKILGISGVGGNYHESNSNGSGLRGQASELCFVPPNVTTPSLAGGVYEDVNTRAPSTGNYLLFVTAQGGQGATIVCGSAGSGSAGGSSRALWNGNYGGGVSQAYYRTPQQNSRFGSGVFTALNYYYTGYCDEDNNQGPGMAGVHRSSNSTDNVCGFGGCTSPFFIPNGRIAWGGYPGWYPQEANQIFDTATRNPTLNTSSRVLGTTTGNSFAAASPAGHRPAPSLLGFGGDSDAYSATGECYSGTFPGVSGRAIIKY